MGGVSARIGPPGASEALPVSVFDGAVSGVGVPLVCTGSVAGLEPPQPSVAIKTVAIVARIGAMVAATQRR